jgi:GT2 family glycosyltransferase
MRDVTFLLPAFNAPAALNLALSTMIKSGINPELITVCNDASTDRRVDAIREKSKKINVTWVDRSENLGYTKNINQAVFNISTKFIYILNTDCFLLRETADRMLDLIKVNEFYACVGIMSNNAGYQTVKTTPTIAWAHLDVEEIINRVSMIQRSLAWHLGTRAIFLPSVNGFCTLWRKSVLDLIGGFDEISFPRGYGEEDDACFRSLRAGYIPVLAPNLFAPHLRTQSFNSVEKIALKKNAAEVLKKKYSEEFLNRVVKYYEKNPFFSFLSEVELNAR